MQAGLYGFMVYMDYMEAYMGITKQKLENFNTNFYKKTLSYVIVCL